MKSIRFIHTADLHLDSPFSGLRQLPETIFKRIQESTFRSFEKMVDYTVKTKADFMLISGDLYDGEDRSIKAQARLRRQMEKLREHEIEVFLLHGNHDHLSGSWTTIELPENVHVFPVRPEMREIVLKNGIKVHLYGFSYPERHVWERVIDSYEKAEGADFHIGLLHGQIEGGSSEHQPYAPFTLGSLLEKKMDYWALGHIHKQQILYQEPFIVYPGNIQGRNRKELGPKGCQDVTLTEDSTSLQFIETADIVWDTVSLSLEGVKDFSALYIKCKELLENIRREGQGVLLKITLVGDSELDEEEERKLINGELEEALQDGEESEDAFVWVIEIEREHPQQSPYWLTEETALKKELVRTLKELSVQETFEKAVEELYFHKNARRYLDPLSETEQEPLAEEALKLLSHYSSSK